MIEIIGHSIDWYGLTLFIAWNKDYLPQEDVELTKAQVLELLFSAGYICDYHEHNGAEVAFYIDGFKAWVGLDEWLAGELNDQVCINLLQQQFNHA